MKTDLHLELYDKADARRWFMSAAFVVAVHATIVSIGSQWRWTDNLAGTAIQPLMIDLQTTVSTEQRKLDIAPGPDMREAPPPTPEQQTKPTPVEQMPVAPVQQNPVVLAAPEKKEKEKPIKEPRKPVAKNPARPSEAPAPRTTATPQAAQAARANYNGVLSAHLQRFKQYPAASRAAGEQGVAMLSFTVSRNGHVLGSRLSKSSGSSALDAETMAMLRRAQPLPSFPAEMTQQSLSVNVPIRFAIR